MDFADLVLPAAALGALAAGAYLSWQVYRRYYRAVPPNRALVVYGASRPSSAASGDRQIDVRAPRIIVGGGVFLPPWRHGADSLSLAPIDVEARVSIGPNPTDPADVPWEARFAVQVKIPTEPRMLQAAAESLLGRSDPELRALVIRVVEAVAPAVVLRELAADPKTPWDRLAAEVQAAVAPELVALGLEVRTLSVVQLRRASVPERPDLGMTGPAPLSRDLLWASGDLGVRLRSAELRLDRTERSLGLLGAEVMRLGRDSSQFPVLPTLQPYDSTGDEPPARPSLGGSSRAEGRGPNGATRPLLDTEG